ncbi:LexA family transcriptional regulator [Afifella sp. H1R]|uniref:LexA family transcriptional regulator n=1 Tax=Afifella sp. H1R TaxID=2908841 RepID=UPI001F15ABB8|nr:LexA family transcriptional regulator [Afifella sp. H1R]MCF1502947.1 LexA family transcriptional regulator [Afifella sp. H1R]
MLIDDRPDYAKRLQQAREARGLATAKDAARRFGWVYETYIQHEQGIRGITRAASKYAKAFRVSEGWLLTGEGGPRLDQTVPLLSWVSAGQMMRDDVADDTLGTVDGAGLPRGDWIALRVEGDSMDRISPPESIIFVNRNDHQLVPNALYVIDDGEGNATYKRYRPGPPKRFEAVSVNTEHEPIFFDNDPKVIGRVRRSMIDM